jgi:two-component system response regulator RegX3
VIRCPHCGTSWQPGRGDTETIGGLTIDYRTREVTVGGELVPVQRKAFRVLSVLASDPGRLFTYEELFREAWGGCYAPSHRCTVRTQIAKLAKTLGSDVLLENVWGVGYRLRALEVSSAAAGGSVEPVPAAAGRTRL